MVNVAFNVIDRLFNTQYCMYLNIVSFCISLLNSICTKQCTLYIYTSNFSNTILPDKSIYNARYVLENNLFPAKFPETLPDHIF